MPAAPIRPGETVRIRGECWTVTSAGPTVRVRGCDAGNRRITTAFLSAAELIERLPPPTVKIVRPARWRREVSGLLAAATPPDALLTAAGATLDVLPYQLEPALAAIRGEGVRLLIADEVGLGKTVQAGLIVAETLARTPDAHILVVSPAGLRDQWQAELRQRFGVSSALLSSATLADAAGWPRRQLSDGHAPSGNPWVSAAVGIASIDFIKRPEVIRSLESLVWDLVVFDEAHGLAGRSDRAQAARALAERARLLVLLTATPHDGDDTAFARLASLGDVGGRFPLVAFRRTRQDAGRTERRRTTWLRVRAHAAEQAMHEALMQYATAVWTDRGSAEPAARLAMIVLARRACSSAASLARSIERRLMLLEGRVEPLVPQLMLPLGDDLPDERVLGAHGLTNSADERRQLERLLDLSRAAATSESKVLLLSRLLRRARQPAIVFTEYRDTLERLAEALADSGPLLLHGGLSAPERREAVTAFTRGDAALLLATDAASEGLNLHDRCRLVINLELPWTPLRLEQRIGRVERIGQRRAVHAVHLIAAGTSEDTTVATLMRRMHQANQAAAAMRPAGAEADVAAAMFGTPREPLAAAPSPVSMPPLHVPDLRDAGRLEAERVLQARALAAAGPARPLGRPVITSRPRGRMPFAACCAYRFVLSDASEGHLGEWFSAIATDRCRRGRGVRQALATAEDASRARLGLHKEQVLTSFADSCRRAVDVAIAREHAILAVIAGRSSRLALMLAQPGLFDRRGERLAEAQREIVREASARCYERLRILHRLGAPAAAEHSLLFAIVAA